MIYLVDVLKTNPFNSGNTLKRIRIQAKIRCKKSGIYPSENKSSRGTPEFPDHMIIHTRLTILFGKITINP
jgi:hypothetical protein